MNINLVIQTPSRAWRRHWCQPCVDPDDIESLVADLVADALTQRILDYRVYVGSVCVKQLDDDQSYYDHGGRNTWRDNLDCVLHEAFRSLG